jgi:hypothetical protein
MVYKPACSLFWGFEELLNLLMVIIFWNLSESITNLIENLLSDQLSCCHFTTLE